MFLQEPEWVYGQCVLVLYAPFARVTWFEWTPGVIIWRIATQSIDRICKQEKSNFLRKSDKSCWVIPSLIRGSPWALGGWQWKWNVPVTMSTGTHKWVAFLSVKFSIKENGTKRPGLFGDWARQVVLQMKHFLQSTMWSHWVFFFLVQSD